MTRISISSGIALLALLLCAAAASAVPVTLRDGLFVSQMPDPPGFFFPSWSWGLTGVAADGHLVRVARIGRGNEEIPGFYCGGGAFCAPGATRSFSGLTGGKVTAAWTDPTTLVPAILSQQAPAFDDPFAVLRFAGSSFTLPLDRSHVTVRGEFDVSGNVTIFQNWPGPRSFEIEPAHGVATATYAFSDRVVSPDGIRGAYFLESAELRLVPIPEPSTLALISTGLFAGAVALRRRFLRRPDS